LLANLADFNASKDAIDIDQMLEMDRYALAMTAQMQSEVLANFERYDFHPAMSRLQGFCSEDLGAFYLDVLKDRLYTSAPRSLARRSAQTALLHITQSLLKLMAPVLSFTAEEAWDILGTTTLTEAGKPPAVTIFTECYHPIPTVTDTQALTTRWTRLREIRAQVMRKLEELRTAGSIGSSLQGEVELTASGDDLALLLSVAEQLPFIFIVSRVSVQPGVGELQIHIAASGHQKCERCWHYRADIGEDAAHPHICGRCVLNLTDA
jgi:isoleucyl-tRNA synthetase